MCDLVSVFADLFLWKKLHLQKTTESLRALWRCGPLASFSDPSADHLSQGVTWPPSSAGWQALLLPGVPG